MEAETIETLPTDGSTERQPNDPTPEQIAEMCAVIRSRWTPAEHQRRLVVKVEPVGVTEVAFDDELPAEW